MALLLNFKQRLVELFYFLVVLLFEIVDHRNCGPSVALLELAGVWVHVKSYIADLVRLVVAIACHHNGSLELVHDRLLNLVRLRLLVGVSLTSLVQALDLLVDQGEAVVDGKIFRDIVNDQVQSTLENPGRGKEARPRLYRVVEDLGFRTHEEAGVSADLAEIGVAHLGLDDGVYEVEGEGVVFHLHLVQLVESELRNALDQNSEFAAEKVGLSLEINLLLD